MQTESEKETDRKGRHHPETGPQSHDDGQGQQREARCRINPPVLIRSPRFHHHDWQGIVREPATRNKVIRVSSHFREDEDLAILVPGKTAIQAAHRQMHPDLHPRAERERDEWL